MPGRGSVSGKTHAESDEVLRLELLPDVATPREPTTVGAGLILVEIAAAVAWTETGPTQGLGKAAGYPRGLRRELVERIRRQTIEQSDETR